MCDIYNAVCQGKCGEEINMHLSDYNTGRDEVEVFCHNCIPDDRSDGVLWQYREDGTKKLKKVFVRALTDNARNNADGNHPNEGYVKQLGVPDGTLETSREKSL